ncbi:MAG: hypothetical protein COB50_01915, partial [Thiotrichales bacterium]
MGKPKEFDVIIVGAGLSGSILALGLAQLNLEIAIIEAKNLAILHNLDTTNTRSIAISYKSRHILEQIGIWQSIENMAVPITAIQVSEKGAFNKVNLNAIQENIPAFGYNINLLEFNQIVLQKLSDLKNVTVLDNCELNDLQQDTKGVRIETVSNNNPVNFQANLLIAADGANSKVRQLLDIECDIHDYHQAAVTCNLEINQSHNHKAFERFLTNGLIAMLPLSGNKVLSVWTTTQEHAAQ